MASPDDLSLVLDLLILVIATVFYTSVLVWFEVRRKDLVRANTHLREGAILLGLEGLFMGLIAVWGEMTWPLFGQYNVFFFDVVLMLSLVLIAFAAAVWYHFPTHFVGMLAVISGLGVLFYGVRAYDLHLTLDPRDTFYLYLSFGAVAIASYPATLFIDWFVVGPTSPGSDPLPSGSTPSWPWIWRVLLAGFLLLVILAGIAAVGFGISTVWGHLGSA
jgi:uncharacterized membrane protein